MTLSSTKFIVYDSQLLQQSSTRSAGSHYNIQHNMFRNQRMYFPSSTRDHRIESHSAKKYVSLHVLTCREHRDHHITVDNLEVLPQSITTETFSRMHPLLFSRPKTINYHSSTTLRYEGIATTVTTVSTAISALQQTNSVLSSEHPQFNGSISALQQQQQQQQNKLLSICFLYNNNSNRRPLIVDSIFRFKVVGSNFSTSQNIWRSQNI